MLKHIFILGFILSLSAPTFAAPVYSGGFVESTDEESLPFVDDVISNPPKAQNPIFKDLGPGTGFGYTKSKPKKKKAQPKTKMKPKVKSHWVSVGNYKGGCRKDNLYEMKRVLSLVNRHRIRRGRGALKISKGCNAFANYVGGRNSKEASLSWALHFNEMSNQSEVRSMLRKNGLSRGVGENIAWGQPGAGICSAEHAVRNWINSPGHNQNMLRSGWKYMGISRVVGRNGIVHWTQCFH